MTIEIINYQPRLNRQTRDTLRRLTISDRKWLIRIHHLIQQIPLCENCDPEFSQWFDMPNSRLPRQDQRARFQYNSPRSFAEGIERKLQQDLSAGDLSPRQCQGIESLWQMLAGLFAVPEIRFQDRDQEHLKPSGHAGALDQLFGEE